MKRWSGFVLAMGVWVSGWMLPAAARAGDGYTMYVVPARYSVLQVSFDLMRHAPVALVSYQLPPKSSVPVLHAWNSAEWIPVTHEAYQSGSFMQNKPSRVVLVGEAATLPPVLAEGARSWCSNVMAITELDTASLVNTSGRILGFQKSDWAWFAARYKMDMKDSNAGARENSWYYGAHPELPKRAHFGNMLAPPAETPVAPVEPAATAPAVSAPEKEVPAPVVTSPATAPAVEPPAVSLAPKTEAPASVAAPVSEPEPPAAPVAP